MKDCLKVEWMSRKKEEEEEGGNPLGWEYLRLKLERAGRNGRSDG